MYEPHEIRLVQERTNVSVANAENVNVGYPGVPAGKMWTVTSFGYRPSVAETQVIAIVKVTRSGGEVGIFNPLSLALNPATATPIEQGMELTLFPGEYMIVYRGGHTVGSQMYVTMQFVESDIPYYAYTEPLGPVVRKAARHGSAYRSTGGISPGTGGTPPTTGHGTPGGGGGRDLPV